VWWEGFGDPYVRTLELDQTAELGNIWDVVWDADGVAYIGSERLWRWDGRDWKLIEGDRLFNVRAMHFDDDGLLWLASHGEFGVLDPKSLEYTSLMNWFPEDQRNIGEVWELHKTGDEFWIGTEYRLFRVSESGFKAWEFSGEHRIIFHFLDSGVYAHQAGMGLWRLEDETFELASTDPDLAEKSVLYLEESEDGNLIAVSGKGVFQLQRVNGYKVSLIRVFEESLHLSSVTKEIDALLLGTLGEGVFILTDYWNHSGSLKSSSWSQERTVINLKSDYNNRLWVLSTEGIELIYLRYPFRIVNENHNYPVGYITSVSVDTEGIGVTTNRGYFIYAESSVSDTMELITDAEVYRSVPSVRGRLFNNYDRLFVTNNSDLNNICDFDRAIRNFTLSSTGHIYVSFSDCVVAYLWNEDNSLEAVGEYPVQVTKTSLEPDQLGNVWGWGVKTLISRFYLKDEGGMGVERINRVVGIDLLTTPYRMDVAGRGPLIIMGDRVVRRLGGQGGWESADHRRRI
jgi:hypothetical protein